MDRSRIVWITALCFGMLMYALSCRGEEERDMRRWSIPGDGGAKTVPYENEEDAPDTERVPDTLPSPGNPDYATDVMLYVGCEISPDAMPVAARQVREQECAEIIPYAFREHADDLSEVHVPYLWDVADPEIVALTFPSGTTKDRVRVRTIVDIFDGDGMNEPESSVWVCAVNTCPQPPPSDCSDLVCTFVLVVSVANLEGTWALTGVTFEPGNTMTLVQDGRSFKDPQSGVKKGVVEGKKVTFEIDDYEYSGTLSQDRMHVSGSVTDLMNYAVIGSWSAKRLGP